MKYQNIEDIADPDLIMKCFERNKHGQCIFDLALGAKELAPARYALIKDVEDEYQGRVTKSGSLTSDEPLRFVNELLGYLLPEHRERLLRLHMPGALK